MLCFFLKYFFCLNGIIISLGNFFIDIDITLNKHRYLTSIAGHHDECHIWIVKNRFYLSKYSEDHVHSADLYRLSCAG